MRLLPFGRVALLTGCEALKTESVKRPSPFNPLRGRLAREEDRAQVHLIQELMRAKRHLAEELVRAQPHLVHDVGRPVIHDESRPRSKMELSNSSQSNPSQSYINQDVANPRSTVDEALDVEEEMERMVHLSPPQYDHQGQLESTDPELELHDGVGAADASLEASGFYGTDTEERGEEGEERERRGEERGEEGWEKNNEEAREERKEGEDPDDVRLWADLETNHSTPDLDSLIGYSPSFLHYAISSPRQPSHSSQGSVLDAGLQEQRGPLTPKVASRERELWEGEREEENLSSGYGIFHSSITTTITVTTGSPAVTRSSWGAGGGWTTAGTPVPETDTGTDFGLVESPGLDSAKAEGEEGEREEEARRRLSHLDAFTQNPTVPEVGVAPSREPLQPSVEEEEGLEQEEEELEEREEEEEEEWRRMERERARNRPLVPLTTNPTFTVSFTQPFSNSGFPLQVVCVDWSELASQGYVILNMTENMNCEEFRADHGVRLLEILEHLFTRKMKSPEGSWVIYLSKPTHQQHQLLMNVASKHGMVATKDVLGMLGEIRRHLNEVGIQNFSAASSCQYRPSQTRSDYGKLFVVLVIIGSVCMVIITSGLIYICWQRRLPATKTMTRAEELHFVENGCHDNPTLDVTNDSQPEMQEKKPSTNGLAGGSEGGGEENSSRWQVFVNQPGSEEEEEEQDTHL
ncbi:podocalyxin-like protein 2 [Lampris incognitus]|uniref:podocalyxin-like protein 2 n=1 Tax=Lampris incognitus TaxID=2546036 RepID=UPI0024B52072|nr:podocalyxin-like protein 2 [Lampris incognitus]